MSDTEETAETGEKEETEETEETDEPEEADEPEPKKSWIFDKLTKRQIDDILETLFILTVCFVFIFFYPLIRYYLSEGIALSRCYYDPPVGHLRPLGGHAAPESIAIRSLQGWPSPIQFYDDYVSESRPVIVKGLAAKFPASGVWTDEYLRETAGSEGVTYSNFEGEYTYNTLDSFLTRYQREQIHLYAEVPAALRGDLLTPPPLTCGNFPSALSEVVLWMNGGNVTVGLNTEVVDGLHCSLQGTQSIVLINRLQGEMAKEGATHSLERRNIDLCWNRSLAMLSWHNVSLGEGDCLYIPSRWYKETTFLGTRNVGVSFRLFRLLYFNQSDCERGMESRLPRIPVQDDLSKFEIISRAENHASLDWFTLRKLFLMSGINNETSLRELFDILDKDGDNEVLPEDMYNMETGAFLNYFLGFRSNDTSRERRMASLTSKSTLKANEEL